VRFGGVLAVNKVSFDVQRGEVFTLIGPNGAGKTTVFNLISRIYTPTTGTLHFEAATCSRQAAARGRGPGHRAHLPEHRAVRERHGAAEPADRPPHVAPRRRLLEQPVLHAGHARGRARARGAPRR
jgi:ABC-type uncharacterized transport system ATPase subunit